jgi:hypothetical protein
MNNERGVRNAWWGILFFLLTVKACAIDQKLGRIATALERITNAALAEAPTPAREEGQ